MVLQFFSFLIHGLVNFMVPLNRMGSGFSKSATPAAVSLRIEKRLEKERLELSRTIKLLLLGTGECGKSTVLKQMRILHSNGFHDSELEIQKSIIHENIIAGIAMILKAMISLQIEFGTPSLGLKKDAAYVLATNVVTKNTTTAHERQFLDRSLVNAIKRLWQDGGVKACFERGSEYHLPDSVKYFLDGLDHIGHPNYVPSQDDILHSRVRTTNIVEVSFEIKGSLFRVYDVGGQRSSRRKWIHCFDSVRAVIFIAALSEYDMKLKEDLRMNRLLESLMLFESICASRWFIRAHIILFLNKKDLFEQKIKKKSINLAFPEYNGPQSYEDSLNFISSQFHSKKKQRNRTIYEHVTCATDTDQMEFVLDSVTDMILTGLLSTMGFDPE